MKTNLWILTEERPKVAVLEVIFRQFAQDNKCGYFGTTLRILPILNQDDKFTFTYEVTGFICTKVDKVYLKIISGQSSLTDFLIFYQDEAPNENDAPLYAIEETKTDDGESRNTGVYQRCSKFVYIKYFFPDVKMIMLYNLQIKQKKTPTDTNIFGTRLLLTLGVRILGKVLDDKLFKPFSSIKELIAFKAKMRKPPAGNVPIIIDMTADKITISGRLYKNGGLSHDPNIGALTVISSVLRLFGWTGEIEITQHGLQAPHVGIDNKFIQIANMLDISLAGLSMPKVSVKSRYWEYDTNGEKLGTIFLHIVVDNFTSGYSIFENHAGCEKGYFITQDNKHIPLAKYQDRGKYKCGDKTQIIYIPDLILIDFERSEIINVEGKKYKFRKKGIEELENYDFIEKEYIGKYYPKFNIIRTVVLYGGDNNEIIEIEVGFLLNENGHLVLGVNAPSLFKEAIANLLGFWAK